jgi:hypothetical protein
VEDLTIQNTEQSVVAGERFEDRIRIELMWQHDWHITKDKRPFAEIDFIVHTPQGEDFLLEVKGRSRNFIDEAIFGENKIKYAKKFFEATGLRSYGLCYWKNKPNEVYFYDLLKPNRIAPVLRSDRGVEAPHGYFTAIKTLPLIME